MNLGRLLEHRRKLTIIRSRLLSDLEKVKAQIQNIDDIVKANEIK